VQTDGGRDSWNR